MVEIRDGHPFMLSMGVIMNNKTPISATNNNKNQKLDAINGSIYKWRENHLSIYNTSRNKEQCNLS